MLKKLAAVCLAAAVVSGTATASAQFTDTPSDAYWSAAVDWATETGVLPEASGMFRPHDQADRQLAALWMWRMEGSPAAATHPFTDVPAEADGAVAWMVSQRITTGTSDTTFSPGDGLTRGQLAAFLWRLAGRPEATPHAFNDVHRDWQQQPVSWMAAKAITTGTSTTTFSPDIALTRAQLVTFLWRYSNRGEGPRQVSAEVCDFSDQSERVRSAVWQVRSGNSIGTAFYIGNDEWLTAAHVVEGATSATLHYGDDELNAVILGGDSDADIALLGASGSGVAPLVFSDSGSVSVGESLFVVGYPLFVAAEPSVTRGVLSRIEAHRDLGTVIVTDASANPGNSGGPLVDECGNVTGMIVQKLVREDVEGIAYAIAAATLQARIPRYRSGGPESIVVARTYTECFGSSASEWVADWSDGAHGWDHAVWQHQSDGRTQGAAYVEASSHSLNDHRNTLPEGCDFTPWLRLWCTAYESELPFGVQVWWAGMSTGTEDANPVTVAYRLDNGNQTNTTWAAFDDDTTYLGGERSVAFIDRLSESQTLEFWGHDSSGTQVIEADFDLTGVDDALEHLQDTCNWDSAQPPRVTPSQQPAGPSAWTSFDGENERGRYTGAYVEVEISEYSWQDDWLRLYVRCTNRSVLDIFLVVDGALFYGSGGPVVEYRFGGQDQLTTASASAGSNSASAFLDDQHSFLRGLRADASGRLFVTLYDWWPYSDRYELEGGGELNTVGVSQHVEPVVAACGL